MIMRELRKGAFNPPQTNPWPPAIYYLPRNYGGEPYDMPLIGLETRGCSWFLSGGCTMCNFGGQGSYVSPYFLIAQASFGLKVCRGRPYLQIAPMGSFFDPNEVPLVARNNILSLVRNSGYVKSFETEARVDHVREEDIKISMEILNDIELAIGVGLESSNSIVRELIVNKGTRQELYLNFFELSKKIGFLSNAHVLLKPAFLTEREAVEDAISSIRWVIDNGGTYAILMTSNLRKFTLNYWLWERGLYKLPMLWSLLEVLRRLDSSYRKRVVLAGFLSNETLLKTAENCSKCTNYIMSKIKMFQYTRDENFLKEAWDHECDCKEEWRRRMEEDKGDLLDRIIFGYKYISEQILGKRWWEENRKWVEKEVEEVINTGRSN
jgi:radical SAM enzyme (TIGR01210 family)